MLRLTYSFSFPCLLPLVNVFGQLVLARYLANAASATATTDDGSALPARERENVALLRQLYALRLLEDQGAELEARGYLSPQQRATLESAVAALCADIRPVALALVDAFDLSDHFLNSALGRYDGKRERGRWGRWESRG